MDQWDRIQINVILRIRWEIDAEFRYKYRLDYPIEKAFPYPEFNFK